MLVPFTWVKSTPQVLKEIGTDYVVIGHQNVDYFHETDEEHQQKAKQSLRTKKRFQSSVV